MSAVTSAEPLLRVRDLRVFFRTRRDWLFGRAAPVRAVDGVSFDLPAGTALGVVGESGCGKSTLARAILRLLPVASGEVAFAGRNWLALPPRELRRARRSMQIVFQDSVGSLNPRRTVGDALTEPMQLHGVARGAAARTAAGEWLERVGLPGDARDRYPHEFSGGQRQRIAIARALVTAPRLVLLDEPTAALDASVQAQILQLLAELRRTLGVSYLFISHHLAVVRALCDEVAVMYAGRIVERGPAAGVLNAPRHPYTASLLAAHLAPDRPAGRLPILPGDPPSPADLPSGCRFHPRCRWAEPLCRQTEPQLGPAPHDSRHLAGCHRADQIAADLAGR
ncbi:MAG: ABC transporter ATP-binding protein [Phycisphaerae bacterium]